MIYNVKQQERFFQTTRIQIVEFKQQYSNRVEHCQIIRRNVYPLPAKAHDCYFVSRVRTSGDNPRDWHYARVGFWSDELAAQTKEVASSKSAHHNKGDAIRIAKSEAVRLSLPFDPARDLISEAEFESGPQQSCVVCGENTGTRSYQSVVCDKCKTALPIGREQLQARFLFGIEAHDLVQYYAQGDSERGSTTLAVLLLKLAGSQLLKSLEYGASVRRYIIGEDGDRSGNWKFGCYLSDEQADCLDQVLAHIRRMIEAARSNGQERGESLLLSLAQGTHTAEQFNDLTIHKQFDQE